MNIKKIGISTLKEYDNNPRNNAGAVESVAASIREFGFKVPVIIDKNNIIIAGHTRVKAAKSLGLDEVPCIIADDLTPEQIKAFRLVDNKTAELAEWDFNKLELELFNIDSLDMSKFGFELSEISADSFGEEFELPDDDKPQTRTITLSLAEEQYLICESAIDYFSDKIKHDYGNKNKRSNALFEAVFEWAEQKKLA